MPPPTQSDSFVMQNSTYLSSSRGDLLGGFLKDPELFLFFAAIAVCFVIGWGLALYVLGKSVFGSLKKTVVGFSELINNGVRMQAQYNRGRSQLGIAACTLVGLSGILSLFGIIPEINTLRMVSDLLSGVSHTEAEINAAFSSSSNVPELIIMWASGIVFAIWTFSSYKRVEKRGVPNMKFSPFWAWASFFVPVVNLVRPHTLAQEIWKASDISVAKDDNSVLDVKRNSHLITAWWALFFLYKALSYGATKYSLKALVEVNSTTTADGAMSLLPNLQTAYQFQVGAELLAIPAAVVTVVYVLKLDQRLARLDDFLSAAPLRESTSTIN